MTEPSDAFADLVERCFTEDPEAAQAAIQAEAVAKAGRVLTRYGLASLGLIVGGMVVAISGPAIGAVMVAAGSLAWLAVLLQGRDPAPRGVERGVQAYRDGEAWAVARVNQFAVKDFRARIAAHRERTMGRDSEWGRARRKVAKAADEAQRSATYWRERLRADPGNPLAESSSETANRLEAKVGKALEELDRRAGALRRFYNECDARLAVMDSHNRDFAEWRRLHDLADETHLAIAEAEGTIQGLAQAFIADAHSIAQALGGVQTVGIKSLAGEASPDNLEFFADAIIESSDRDRAMVEDLENTLFRS